MINKQLLCSVCCALAVMVTSVLADTPAVELYIISPADGEQLDNPVVVRFGLSGMGVAPAGVNVEGSGHHHLLIDLDDLPDMTQALPANSNIRHFGKGQTEVSLELSPGKHSLQLILGDYLHIPFDPPIVSKKITIQVN